MHEDSTVNNAFTSIDTSANLTNLTTDNTWGYSTSLDNGTTWSTYSGLPSTTTKPLLDVSDPATPSTIDFKIAAKSSTTQASGTYNNVITFYAVGKPEPVYMQDVDIIKTKLKNEHDVLAVIDQRDGREYTAAKLKDGKNWMTQNLDLAGGTKLYSETSDVPSGFPSSNNIPYYTLPYSSIYGFSSNTAASLYNVPYSNTDRTKCGKDHPCYSYYSWLAATANSGRNIATNDVDAPYSICPRGWRLPTSRSTVAGNSDFYQLAVAYGMKTGVLYQTTNIVRKQIVSGTVPNFAASGWFTKSNYFQQDNHSYWSSTSGPGNTYAMWFYFSTPRKTSTVFTTMSNGERRMGEAVRCILK